MSRTVTRRALLGSGIAATAALAAPHAADAAIRLDAVDVHPPGYPTVEAVKWMGEELARESDIARVILTNDQHVQPRMLTFLQLKAITKLLSHFDLVSDAPEAEIAATAEWLGEESKNWMMDVTTDRNYAKQLALQAVGKTPVFYGGELTWSLAYKWKISWNENAKNVAFWGRYPEVNHNEFMGWTSHPIEKPFAVFDLVSGFERQQIKRRFEISDRLLSGKRPKATTIDLAGDTLLKQLFWGNILADYASIYTAVLNNVDPGPVPLITKLKQELSDNI